MAISRYQNSNQVLDEEIKTPRLSSFPSISSSDIFSDDNVLQIRYVDGMRFDSLASEYLGDGRYWWMICLANDIHLPFGNNITPGKILRIPTNPDDIIRLLRERENKI